MKLADRCPGVLRPHQAADGAMVRIRIPGGQTTGPALARLSAVAQTYGSGLLQLTSRGSVQLRGLPPELPEVIAETVRDAGFLPSPEHERVRNIAASPLTGLSGGLADLRLMVGELDAALQAAPELAELPGRFLFVLDDGRGDVAGLAVDLGYRALGPDHGLLLVGSGRRGRPVRADAAVTEMIILARSFLARRDDAWHVRDLVAPLAPDLDVAPEPGQPAAPLGRIQDHASVAAPLGMITPDQVAMIAALVDDGPLVITPWRGLVLPGGAAHLPALEKAGLIIDEESAWSMISACVGAPWCASGRVDTRTLASQLIKADDLPRTHLSGCERRCGAPVQDHLDLVAPTLSDAYAAIKAHHG